MASFEVFPDLKLLSMAVAQHIVEQTQHLAIGQDAISLVLAGGSTPKTLYALLATKFIDAIDWRNVHLFWGDERCLPLDSADSNYQMAFKTLLSKISIPSENVHVPPMELGPPDEIARVYESEIREFFGEFSKSGVPQFDIVLLGMGSDGHTASLFPGGPELRESAKLVVSVNNSPTPPHVQRVSLSLPVLRTAKHLYLLVSGESKAAVIKDIVKSPEDAKLKYPAAQAGLGENAIWFLDRVAAGES